MKRTMVKLLITAFSFFMMSIAENSSPLWTFSADGSIAAMDTIGDCSDPAIANGGNDLVIGTDFDTLYLLEGKSGAGQNKPGEPLWSYPLLSSVNAIKAVPDMNIDKRPDIAIGDMNGTIALMSGGSGTLFWIYIANSATILSIDKIPDINGDGVPEIIAGADNDSVYCLSGLVPNMWDPAPEPRLNTPLWIFNTNPVMIAKKAVGGAPNKKALSGANSVCVIYNNTSLYGIIVGASSNAIFCLSPANKTPVAKWKCVTTGDIWDVKSFPDINNDGINEVLAACGDNKGYLVNGKDGNIIWTHSVDSGATVVSVIGDQDGDGFADAIIGDGTGKIHCISGKASGVVIQDLWTYSTGDNQTVTSICNLKDVNGDNKDECIFGSTNDSVYVLSSGDKLWSGYMGGTVTAVSSTADINDDGTNDVVAVSDGSICTAFKGQGTKLLNINRMHVSEPPNTKMTIKTNGKKILASFDVNTKSAVSFSIVDNCGRILYASNKTIFEKGTHSFSKGLQISSGNYFLILKTGNNIIQQKFQFF